MLSAAVDPKEKHQKGEKAWERLRKHIDRVLNKRLERFQSRRTWKNAKRGKCLSIPMNVSPFDSFGQRHGWKNIVHARSTSTNV